MRFCDRPFIRAYPLLGVIPEFRFGVVITLSSRSLFPRSWVYSGEYTGLRDRSVFLFQRRTTDDDSDRPLTLHYQAISKWCVFLYGRRLFQFGRFENYGLSLRAPHFGDQLSVYIHHYRIHITNFPRTWEDDRSLLVRQLNPNISDILVSCYFRTGYESQSKKLTYLWWRMTCDSWRNCRPSHSRNGRFISQQATLFLKYNYLQRWTFNIQATYI